MSLQAKNQPGYRGMVTLVSPTGERVSMWIQGRVLTRGYDKDGRWVGGQQRNLITPTISGSDWERANHKRESKRFNRLLSQGWRVVNQSESTATIDGAQEEGGVGAKEEKKNTDVVIGTTKTGNQSHGGDHASGEVKDSPNHAERGYRGGRGKVRHKEKQKERKEKKSSKQPAVRMAKCAQKGGGNVYCPQPFQITPGLAEAAKKSAQLLAELVGRSAQKFQHGTYVKVPELLIALETGDDPIPPLEAPRERPRLRVLVTPDCSGSCQNWSGVGRAWSKHLSRIPDADIYYVENSNGEFQGGEDAARLIPKIDVVIYLGDGDGLMMCQNYAAMGAMVLALDCGSASVAKPRLNKKPEGVKGDFFWIDRVSNKVPETWYQALCLALGRQLQ